MKKRYSAVYSALAGVILALLVIIVSITFITQMNTMIENNIINTIQELADHDKVSIQNFLEQNWNELYGIQNRITIYDCQTILEVQERMNLERATGNFYTLYLIDADGNVYTDRYVIYSKEETDVSQFFGKIQDRVVVPYNLSTTTEAKKEMVLYAVPLEDYTVEGVHFVALAGLSNINQIQDHFTLYSFYKNGQSRGYSSVVDPDGNYIVNVRRTISLNQRENMYEILDSGTMESGWTNEKIAENIRQENSFYLDYTGADGVDKLGYFTSVEDTDWYLVMMVEKSVFTDLSKSFVFTSIFLIFLSLTVSAIAALLVIRSRRSILLANAEAKARGDFLSNMSHEIRTPLNGVIGSLHLIRGNVVNEDLPKAMEWLDKADDTVRYLLSLINDILDMSKLQAGKLKLSSEPFLPEKMLDDVLAMQQSNAESRGVCLTLEKNIQTPCVKGDEIRLKQVLMNILSNAIKFTPVGGKVDLSFLQDPPEEGRVKITIICTDTGIGMSQQFLSHIWDSFSQESNKVSDGTQGTGLGMSITKYIVDVMGGKITVSSELGKGSTFTITLSLEVAQMPELPEAFAAPGKTASDSAGPLRILVAEDNELNAAILTEILTAEGFEVVSAENGSVAVELFAQSAPGTYYAILMDVQMPVMDGYQATAAIRSLDRIDAKTIKILACTANAFREDLDRALKSGMDDFLPKPIDIKVLLDKLSKTIERQEYK